MSAVAELPGFSSVKDAEVCNWYFFVFVLVTIAFLANLMKQMLMVGFAKVPVLTKVIALVLALAVTGFAIANAGFQFTMCKRALSV